MVAQEIFTDRDCRGQPHQVYTYPIQQECLVYNNGSQTFEADARGNTIIQKDYQGQKLCGGAPDANATEYVMRNFYCYRIWGTQAFRWSLVDTPETAATSGA